MIEKGVVTAAHGRHYTVRLDRGEELSCFPRGKKSTAACGDCVQVRRSAHGQGVIEAIAPRRNLLYRSDAFKQKAIAANVDQLLLVCATEPAFSESLLTRCLVAAEHEHIPAIIVLNKIDLSAGLERARALLAPYRTLGYAVLELSAHRDVTSLIDELIGKTTVLVGQSGMGKSTLLNALVPGAGAATREISTALDSGKHTTTHVRLYAMDGATALIDSPGMQEFGLFHLDRGALEAAFRELHELRGACRFRDCRHDAEPGCAVQAAVAQGRIHPRRHAEFLELCRELGR